jgi:hypothetical protein
MLDENKEPWQVLHIDSFKYKDVRHIIIIVTRILECWHQPRNRVTDHLICCLQDNDIHHFMQLHASLSISDPSCACLSGAQDDRAPQRWKSSHRVCS